MKKINLTGCAALLALTLAGCYSYKEPGTATLGESYTARQRDAADEMFKNIKVLTLREAQRIAIRNNPTYIAAYHSVEAARMRYYQAWGAYSPTVTASFNLQNQRSWRTNYHSDPNNETYQRHTDAFTTTTGVQANMLLFDGFARFFRLKAAKSSLSYYEKLEEDACRTMTLSVAYAYNTVLLSIEQRRIAIENRKFQMDSLKNTQYKFEAGAAPLSDVLNFEIQVNNADVDMIAADYQYEIALYALAELMGYSEGTLPSSVTFPDDLKSEFIMLPSVDVYLDAALANRPDLKAYREQLKIAQYQVYQAYGAYSPTVNGYVQFGFGTNALKNPNYYYSDEKNRDYYNNMNLAYGITADWTVFNGAIRYNQLREAKASKAVADFQVAAKWYEVVSGVRTAYANYIQSVKKTKLYAKVRDLSAKQRELVDDEYRAGNAELTRLNEAQRDLVEAETNLASSYINIQNAKAQLASVVGVNNAEFYLNSPENKNDPYPGLGGAASIVEELKKGSKSAANTVSPVTANVNAITNAPASMGPAQSAKADPVKLPEKSQKNIPVEQKENNAPAAPAAKSAAAPAAPAKQNVAAPAAPEKKAAPAIPETATAPAK